MTSFLAGMVDPMSAWKKWLIFRCVGVATFCFFVSFVLCGGGQISALLSSDI